MNVLFCYKVRDITMRYYDEMRAILFVTALLIVGPAVALDEQAEVHPHDAGSRAEAVSSSSFSTYALLETPLKGGALQLEGGLDPEIAVIRRDAASGGLGAVPQLGRGGFIEVSLGTGTHWMPTFVLQTPDTLILPFSIVAFDPYVGLEAGVRWVSADEGEGASFTLLAGFAPRTDWEMTAYRLSPSLGVVNTVSLYPSSHLGQMTFRLRGPVRTWGGGHLYVHVLTKMRFENYSYTAYLQDGTVETIEGPRLAGSTGMIGFGYVKQTSNRGYFRIEPALGFERMRMFGGWTTWPSFLLRLSLGHRGP